MIPEQTTLDAGIPTDLPDDINLADIIAEQQGQYDEWDSVIPLDFFL